MSGLARHPASRPSRPFGATAKAPLCRHARACRRFAHLLSGDIRDGGQALRDVAGPTALQTEGRQYGINTNVCGSTAGTYHPGGFMKSDAQLERDVRDELHWDPSVNEKDIAIGVTDGVVTLAGSVTDYARKSSPPNTPSSPARSRKPQGKRRCRRRRNRPASSAAWAATRHWNRPPRTRAPTFLTISSTRSLPATS